jgi:hypothetical protein
MYIVKSETQAFADSASFAATLQLDGTATGITRAQTAVTNNPKKSAFTNVTTSFATASTGPWTPLHRSADRLLLCQSAGYGEPAHVPMALWGPNARSASAVAAAADPPTTAESSFSPYTRIASSDNPADPYGFLAGNQYTLRWGSPGNHTTCGTDATQPNLSTNGNVRGYCCVQGASTLRDAIVGGDTIPLSLGDSVQMFQGAVNTAPPSIAWKVNLIRMPTQPLRPSTAPPDRNGARVVMVPVNGGAPGYLNLGFAAFFLLQHTYYEGLNGNDAACGVYIGRYLQGQQIPPAPGGSGIFHIKLFQ